MTEEQEATPAQVLQHETQKLIQAVGIINAGQQLQNDNVEDASIEAFEEQLDTVREIFEEYFKE